MEGKATMSARSFRSVFMVASCAGAALGCYLVSLRVASERSALEGVETQIVTTQRDIRLLQTEIGTRGRLAQLERWNVKVLALSAPAADQFLNGSFELAKLAQPERHVDIQAPVVLAAAPAPASQAPLGQTETDDSGGPAPVGRESLLHQASLKTGSREAPASLANAQTPERAMLKSTEKPVAAAKPAPKKSVDKPGLAAAKPVTKAVRIAKNDPLAPLPGKSVKTTARDTGSER
jgi:hypothetical protein